MKKLLSIQRVNPQDKCNKNKLNEFLKHIPKKELIEIGIPKNDKKFNEEFDAFNIVSYIIGEEERIYGVLFAWDSKALYINNSKPLDDMGNLNLVKINGWELLGAFTREDMRGKGINTMLLNHIVEDAKKMNIPLHVIIRSNVELEMKLHNIYKKHIKNFNKIIKVKDYNFDSYVNYLLTKKIPGREIIELINTEKNYSEDALFALKLWESRVEKGLAQKVGNYFMDGAPFYIST